ncbi:hypothetical protein PpBr36_02520 [Pyricularia pennisetigena]|uniref:hypothetical protein n=1 Tax=Pyricularia pennisetigena TaxID=1578925 RepID=UPI001150B164|nr:hypothetical protein PpBr36_02520 [Pyricularia pennisetigena]TLS30596.1 hypothetical protein PpBr36_02520 [Pyricularia pennisetigena]
MNECMQAEIQQKHRMNRLSENRLPAVVGNWNSGIRDGQCLFITSLPRSPLKKSSHSAKPFSESQLR